MRYQLKRELMRVCTVVYVYVASMLCREVQGEREREREREREKTEILFNKAIAPFEGV